MKNPLLENGLVLASAIWPEGELAATTEQPAPRNKLAAVVDGELRNLSVSQIAKFDPQEEGGCNRRWWREYVLRDKPPQTRAQLRGDDFHQSIERYLKTSNPGMMGERVLASRHIMPAPGPDLMVEWKFGPGEKFEILCGGVPLNGKIDLLHARGEWVDSAGAVRPEPPGMRVAEVRDWKTTSSIAKYAKRGERLVETAQMASYGVIAIELWPELTHVRLSHGYIQTADRRESEVRSALVPVDTVNSYWQRVEGVARAMAQVARETEFLKVEPNFAACGSFGGCPHKQHCPRSAVQAAEDLFGKGSKMSLIGKRNTSPAPAAAAAPPQPAPTAAAPAGSIASRMARSLARGQSPEVAAEVERLAAAAPGSVPSYAANPGNPAAPLCWGCGAALDPRNSSRLSDGSYKHIACPIAPADVLPPDAPASKPHLAAQAIPPEVLLTLPAHVQEAVREAEARALESAAASEQAPAAAETAKARTTRRRAATTSPGPAAAEHVAPPAQHVVHVTPVQSVRVGRSAAEREYERDSANIYSTASAATSINLFINVAVVGELRRELASLDNYLMLKVKTLCDRYRAADIQCAPDDTPLAFGKWKGALAALIRAEPPPAGAYLVWALDNDDVCGVLVRTLAEMAATVVRGVR